MLANNNQSVINKLAKNTLHTNRKKFGILFFTVVLSAFMIFSVFTIGITYLELSRLQNTRLYGAEYDIVLMNGFTSEQKNSLLNNNAIQTVGAEAYAGYIKSTDFDQTANVGLLWCDEIFWEKQSAPAKTKIEGHYPQQKNELMVTKEALKNCGKGNLGVGDSFTLTYENNTGVKTEEFLISGLWHGYGDQSPIFVSTAFYEETGYNLESDGILHIKFHDNFVLPGTIKEIEQSLHLTKRQSFQPSDYIENSLKIVFGLCGLCLFICFSAYLLIFNMLYLSVSGNIRYYGLLQSLGMTKKQLLQFIRKQIMFIAISGIIAGIMAGIFTTLLLVPYVMKVLGISSSNMELHFYPIVFFFSIVTTGIAILCGSRKPIQIATNVTAVEAIKYYGYTAGSRRNKRVKKGNFFWRMAVEQLKKDKKKVIVVFFSLATSLTVFYCLSTIIGSQGERTILPNYWDSDFIIRNSTQIPEDMNSIQPAITYDMIAAIEKIEGVKDLHVMTGFPILFPYDDFSDTWMQNFVETKPYMSYEETISEYQEHPENYYGMVKAIDEAEFDYLNESLAAPVDKQDFLNGSTCIMQYPGFTIPEEYTENKKITFYLDNRSHEISIGAINYETYYGASRNIGANIIVSQNYLKTLTATPYILSLNMKYAKAYDEHTENQVQRILEKSAYQDDLYWESTLDTMKTIQNSQGNMMEIGSIISLLLLFVGVLNYANTMENSIQNRKLTFSVMESVGMSKKQIYKLLIREGLLYAICSIFITLTLGTLITYICFQSLNYMAVPFTIPMLPLVFAILLVLFICTVTPLLSYKKLSANRSITERLQEYE